jgi:hypothetical protein
MEADVLIIGSESGWFDGWLQLATTRKVGVGQGSISDGATVWGTG